jgi:hypothetical protein
LEEADNSPTNSDSMPIIPPPKVLETQDNIDESGGEGDNIILKAVI